MKPLPNGFSVRRTAKGYTVVEIDWFAHPERGKEYLDHMRAVMPSEATFQREILRQWVSSRSGVLYPEYAPARPNILREPRELLAGPIYRGWDFGGNRSACVWAQFSPASQRVWILRELSPTDIGTHSLRDLVLYLSGQGERSELASRPQQILGGIENAGMVTPWFLPGNQYEWIDFASDEGEQKRAEIQEESVERSSLRILAARGIVVQAWRGPRKARVDVLKRLLTPRPDGTYGFYLSPTCKLLDAGLLSGITYEMPTPKNPYPENAARSRYSDVHDALGYILVNLIPPEDTLPENPAPVVGYNEERAPIMAQRAQTTLDFYENRRK
jgi:hypothetical protein